LIAFSSLLFFHIYMWLKKKEWNQVLPGIPLGFYTFCSQRSGSCKTTFEEQIILRFIETYPHRETIIIVFACYSIECCTCLFLFLICFLCTLKENKVLCVYTFNCS
jgi:hypothetical protein